MTKPSPLLGLIIKHSSAVEQAKAAREALAASAREKGAGSMDPVYNDSQKNK
jgi:hypothetical protein